MKRQRDSISTFSRLPIGARILCGLALFAPIVSAAPDGEDPVSEYEEQEVVMLPPGEFWTQEDPAGFDAPLDVTIAIPSLGYYEALPTEVEVLQEEPKVIALVDIPGGAWVFEDPLAPSGWTLFTGGVGFPLTWDSADVAFETAIGIYDVQIRYEKELERDRGTLKAFLVNLCARGRFIGVGIGLIPGFPPPHANIEFYQFFTLKIRYEGKNAAGGAVANCAPPGTTLRIPGHPTTPASADGTRSYTDAPLGDFGRYPANPQGPQGGVMVDMPGGGGFGSVNWPGGVLPPPLATLDKVIIERRFTTYIVYNGQVVFVVEWDVVTEIVMGPMGIPQVTQNPGGPAPNNEPRITPADNMDPHHVNALITHMSTAPGGQDPGTALPPGSNR